MHQRLFTLIGGLILSFLAQAAPNWMPIPAKYTVTDGRLALDRNFKITLTGYTEARLESTRARLLGVFAKQTQYRSSPASSVRPTLTIHTGRASALIQNPGEDESYALTIDSREARLDAPNPLGALHGIETFQQLIEHDNDGWFVPAVVIDDRPRFPWRGLHIDVSRHWMPSEVIKRNLDGMAAVKLNVFHWHLSDDQGFRVESKIYPKLQRLGSDGHFYKQDEIRNIVAYARGRGIRVVPEFDIPGHTTAMIAAYPELAAGPGPYEIERKFGVFDPTLGPSKESVYAFLDGFIGEMAALFPDEYFHIGGDEVTGKQWKQSAAIQTFMREHSLKDNHELQRYFNRRVQTIAAKYGKRMEGWDEILDPDLPKSIVIQSWRGEKSLAEAVRQGYAGILSSGYYLDNMRTAAYHYLVDPGSQSADSLSQEERARILGGEVCTWTEFMSPENIDSRIWPRTAAIAERLWSPQDVRDVDDMYRRLEPTSRYLALLGLTHRSSYEAMLKRLAGGASIESLRTLADVLEPVKMYARHSKHKEFSFTPLTRLTDTVAPESATARDFANAAKARDWATVRSMLTKWRDNRPSLTGLLSEAQPLSDNLNRAAAIGLALLDGKPADRLALAEMEKPTADLVLMVIPTIESLNAER